VKIGIIVTGNVGCACAMAAVTRSSAREIVLVNRTRKTAEAVATDMRYGTPLGPKVENRSYWPRAERSPSAEIISSRCCRMRSSTGTRGLRLQSG
jgi:shikimate 5-dehydrogenase